MANKTVRTNDSRRRTPARKTLGAKKLRRQSWKKVFERNLILEGYSPAEAKELVAISAA